MENKLVGAVLLLLFVAVVIVLYVLFKDSFARTFSYLFKLF